MLRQPIITVLGHVDHGKTTLLDKIRSTAIAAKEAGGITQAIGTTEIPSKALEELCGPLLEKFKFNLEVPGLLFIDTPGHEAFTTLRKRGGSIADIAILVVDIVEGMMPQTLESLEILKTTKTPFVVAVNKIDKVHGWKSNDSFLENVKEQSELTMESFDKYFYNVVAQFSNQGFSADRFDRISDFRQTLAMVPVSCKSGEGVKELLTILIGLSQQFLKNKLVKTENSAGIILEVKEYTGLGITLDSVIYDGSVSRNDFLVIGGKNPKITKIRALLQPDPLKDMRTEKKFHNVDSVVAAAGVKIAAPNLEDVVAGSAIMTAKTKERAELLANEMKKEVEETEIHAQKDGLILKADTLGSLEALIYIFKNYPIRLASIGTINKEDVISAEANSDSMNNIVIGFNVSTAGEAEKLAKDKNITVLNSNIIYKLIEDYEKWTAKKKEDIVKQELENVTKPGKLRILPGHVFRASNPAIVGCEILGGFVKPGYKLFKESSDIGEVKQIQSQGENVTEAKIGDKVAVSITGPTVGRQIKEGDILFTGLSGEDYKKLKKFFHLLTEHEKQVLEEITELKRKHDPRWGL